jgi:hypothetical protein
MPKERKPSAPKLTRQQVKDGLDYIPIDTLLLGKVKGEQSLSHKQKEFARLVALGETKTGAYRKAYNSKGKPEGQAVAGCRLAQDSKVALMIEAYQLANEAAQYRTPAQLRELVIHQLTQHALNDECPPAQRIKALELLGKVSEVAAFTERKETTVIKQSSDIKTRLLESLRSVIDVDAKVLDADAESLLEEISGAKRAQDCETAQPEPHRTPTQHTAAEASDLYIHTNLDNKTPLVDIELPNPSSPEVSDILDNTESNLGEIEDERS